VASVCTDDRDRFGVGRARLAQGLCAAPGLEGTRVALTALALPDGEVLGAHAVEPDSCA